MIVFVMTRITHNQLDVNKIATFVTIDNERKPTSQFSTDIANISKHFILFLV